MNKQGEIFLKTCIEYLKEMDETSEGKEIQTILRRSTIDFIKTNKFSNKIWNKMKENINLRVPIPLLARAKELRNDLVQLFGQVYKETQSYAFGDLILGPKYLEDADINYKEYDVVFDSIEKTIIEAIRDAKYVIWIAVAWFTNSAILDELKKKKSDGLNVRIVTSEEYSNRYLLENMAQEFEVIPIKKCGNNRLHDKFCIIDFEYVMHGSYNWSENAKNNNETWSTALDRDLVKKFADEFINLYSKKDSNENWFNSF